MSQHRLDSMLEAAVNTAIGFSVSLLTWIVVSWAYGVQMSMSENVQITGWFTLVSLLRQYLLRRFFNGKNFLHGRRVNITVIRTQGRELE